MRSAPESAPLFGSVGASDWAASPVAPVPADSPEPALESGVSPPPVCAAWTTTVPRMFGCGVQMYENVPASLKVCERLSPAGKMPVSNAPFDEVAECGVGPLFTQVTVSPTPTVIVPGLKLKSTMVTEPLAAARAVGFGLGSDASSSWTDMARGQGGGG